MGKRAQWEAVLALGVVLLLASTSLPRPAPLAASPEDGTLPLPATTMQDPIEVGLALASSPHLDRPSRLQIEIRSLWGDLSEVTAELEVSEELQVSNQHEGPTDLARDEVRTWDVTILPLAAGLLRVAVWVRGTSAEYGALGGHAVLFLVVRPGGPGVALFGQPPVESALGPTSQVADPLAVPSATGRAQRPNPATPTAAVWQGNGSGDTPVDPRSHASFNVTGQWAYWREDDTTRGPQRWATVEVWDEDSGDDDLLWTGTTDETGNFTALDVSRVEEAGQGNQDVYVRFVACNTAVCVRTTNGTMYTWQTETVTVANEDELSFGSRASGTNEFAQRPFHYINNAWDYAVNLGGLGPVLGQVQVLLPGPCTFYTLADDTIHLCADGVDDKSPDDVGHEYAHYVQDKMYGDNFWPSSGGLHFACGDGQHRGLSWTEGFADFFGPRAHQEIIDSQDHFYTRPWDGSIFSLDLEDVGVCPANVRGDDNELRVASALWDLTDSADDGLLDVGIQHGPSVLFDAVTGCDQASYRAFYDGGLCNWLDRGNSPADFLSTAFLNTIDYNLAPVAQVTSPSVFEWSGSILVVSATATDVETSVSSVEFRISTSGGCINFEFPMVTDTSPPYGAELDIALLTDAFDYWVCARAADELEVGVWSSSTASFGVDRISPASVAVVTGTLGVEGWYATPATVELQASDATSGVASISYRLDDGGVLMYDQPFEIRDDGVHTLAFFAMDVAGNVESVQPLLVLIDTGPPVIQILQPTSSAYVGRSVVALAWSVTDSGAGVEGCSVSLDGGAPVPVEGDTAFAFQNVPDGPHRAAVTCTDRVDRIGEVEVSFTVDTNPFSPTGPVGPTLDMAIAGLVILFVALLLRRRK